MKSLLHNVRHIVLGVLVIVAHIPISAQTVGEAFYIYRNDGHFNAFFRDEVQSIEYSYEDVDGNIYDEIVTQIVNTVDSVYKIPLASIDSVSFVQPTPLYQENVIELSGSILDYIISVKGMTLLLRNDIPSNLMPSIGDKLAQLHFSKVFPDGFVGQVNNISTDDDGIYVTCDNIAIEDVVKRFFAVYKASSITGESATRSDFDNTKQLFCKTFRLGTIPIQTSLEMIGDTIWKNKDNALTYGGKGDLSIDLTPTIDIRVTFSKDDLFGILPQYNIHTVTHFNIQEELQLVGELNGELKAPFPVPEWLKDYPLIPGVNFYLDTGLKVSGSGEAGFGLVSSQKALHTMDINIYPIIVIPAGIPIPLSLFSHKTEMTDNSMEWPYLYGNIEFKIGPYVEFGFSFINHKIAKVGAEFDAGVKGTVNAEFSIDKFLNAEENTDFYDVSKDESKIKANFYIGSYAILAAFNEKLKWSIGGDIDLDNLYYYEAFLFPSFQNVQLLRNQNTPTTLTAFADVDNYCVFPLSLGFSLFDKNNKKVKTLYYDKEYKNPETFQSFNLSFADIASKDKYIVYPTIRLFKKDILASPYSVIMAETDCPNDNHPHWIDLGLPSGTKWRCCNEGASTPEAYGGYYAFGQVSTAPSFEQITELLDNCSYTWTTQNGVNGGKFTGPNGCTIFLPAAGGRWNGEFFNDAGSWGDYWSSTSGGENGAYELGFHSDDAYWYNAWDSLDERPVRSVCKESTNEIQFCPDDNHPHMIDLGLPSGTKWACCNVGAEKPEEYGGYYAWGETQIKNVYDWSTYAYFIEYKENGVTTCDNIGSDIAGTIYDTATANWGESWCMPTKEQYIELINNTTSEWMTLNSINGRRFTAANGNSIFLPAAGYRMNNELFLDGGRGDYWTSTYNDGWSSDSFVLDFSSERLSSNMDINGLRSQGIPVRPVRK